MKDHYHLFQAMRLKTIISTPSEFSLQVALWEMILPNILWNISIRNLFLGISVTIEPKLINGTPMAHQWHRQMKNLSLLACSSLRYSNAKSIFKYPCGKWTHIDNWHTNGRSKEGSRRNIHEKSNWSVT